MRTQIFVMVILLVITACSDNSANITSPTPFFPRQRNARPDNMNALFVGDLALVDGCLRVNDSNGNSFLLVWPQGFSLRTEGNVIQVIDNTGRSIAQVGDKLKVSGGEAPAEHIVEYSAQPLSSSCPGPYWIVGEQINR